MRVVRCEAQRTVDVLDCFSGVRQRQRHVTRACPTGGVVRIPFGELLACERSPFGVARTQQALYGLVLLLRRHVSDYPRSLKAVPRFESKGPRSHDELQIVAIDRRR